MNIIYNEDEVVTTLFVNNQPPILYAYDDDLLLTQAGALNIELNPDNGLITGTVMGNSETTVETSNT